MDRSTLVATMSARQPAMLADIETLVRCESPSSVPEAVKKSADVVAAVGQQHLGTAPELLVVDECPHLRWRLGGGQARVLVLAHHDTVWPLGSLETHPFSLADGKLRGPGCFDMKAGLVLALHALAASGVPDGVTLLVTGTRRSGRRPRAP
ncbi:MAG: M20/M25/M40 family metallo-hydrolase [Trebonia sp.]